MREWTNPVVLRVAGDKIVGKFRILSFLWVGVTTSGDTVQINDGNTWEGRTDGTQTYIGMSFQPHGLPVNGGITLTQISAGKVLVYIVEA